MVAMIVAGGKGTRLSNITKDEIPKPMAAICGKPILERAIEKFKKFGITDIIISVGHLHEKIQEYFGDGSNFGVSIRYIVEPECLGSAGALYFVKDMVDDDFFVCSGDIIFDLDLDRLVNFHKRNNALLTLVTHPNAHPYDSDLVVADGDKKVVRIDRKNTERNYFYKNNVNAGFFVVNPDTLNYFDELKKVNMEHDFISSFIDSGRVYSYKTTEYIKDVGTPERFFSGERDLQQGVVARKNLCNKQKAVFLDRDGVINKYKGFINSVDDIELIEGVAQAIRKLNQSDYLTLIVSNQPVIARGECSFDEVNRMFDKIETLLGLEGAYVDGYYYCPHHPDSGFDGEVKELKIRCDCRKPQIGMLLKASQDNNLDMNECCIVGDANIDVATGNNAKIKTIRVNTGKQEETQLKADFTANSLLQAVEYILGEK